MSFIATKYWFPLQRKIQMAAPIVGLCSLQVNLGKMISWFKSFQYPWSVVFFTLTYFSHFILLLVTRSVAVLNIFSVSYWKRWSCVYPTWRFIFMQHLEFIILATFVCTFILWVEIGPISKSLWSVKSTKWKINYIIILAWVPNIDRGFCFLQSLTVNIASHNQIGEVY